MDSTELNRIRNVVALRRVGLREEVTRMLHVRKEALALVLETCRLAGAKAKTNGLGRDTNPFNRLLFVQGGGTIPLDTTIARSGAWLEGWDQAPNPPSSP